MGKILIESDVTDGMQAEVIAEEVIAKARTWYRLREVCRVQESEEIVGKLPIQTNLAGQEKVGELVEAELSALSFTDVEIDMWKNVVHVAVSSEAKLRSKYDLLRMSIQDAAKDIARMENKQIAEMMDNATALAGADWSNDANSPMDDIQAATALLNNAGYEPQWLVMTPNVYEAFSTNAKVVDAYVRGATVGERIPSVLGLAILVDPNLTDKQAWVVDKNAPAFLLADGPEVVTEYHGGPKFYTGYAIADFLEPQLVISEASRRLTGVLP